MKTAKGEILPASTGGKVFNFIGFFGIHAACIFAIWTGVTLRAVGIAFALYWIRMFLITGVYHRYFSHKAYKTSRWFQFVLGFLTTTAVQKGPIWWTSKHIIHHKYSDKDERDVHSPKLHGFWQSHMFWFLLKKNSGATEMRYVKDLAKFPELFWLDRNHWVAPTLLTILCYYLAGWSGVVVGMAWSTVIFTHSTFSVNSLAHVWGSRRYQTTDDSRNNWFIAIFTMGEGWHNNHHHFQKSARQGFKWWEIDCTYYLLRLLALTRLIWDLEKPPKEKLTSKLVGVDSQLLR